MSEGESTEEYQICDMCSSEQVVYESEVIGGYRYFCGNCIKPEIKCDDCNVVIGYSMNASDWCYKHFVYCKSCFDKSYLIGMKD